MLTILTHYVVGNLMEELRLTNSEEADGAYHHNDRLESVRVDDSRQASWGRDRRGTVLTIRNTKTYSRQKPIKDKNG